MLLFSEAFPSFLKCPPPRLLPSFIHALLFFLALITNPTHMLLTCVLTASPTGISSPWEQRLWCFLKTLPYLSLWYTDKVQWMNEWMPSPVQLNRSNYPQHPWCGGCRRVSPDSMWALNTMGFSSFLRRTLNNFAGPTWICIFLCHWMKWSNICFIDQYLQVNIWLV